jgi:hypothetical protein
MAATRVGTRHFERLRALAVCFGQYHRGFAKFRQRLANPRICVIGFVSDPQVSLHPRQKLIGSDQVMRLSAGQREADRVAEDIDQSVDLGVLSQS